MGHEAEAMAAVGRALALSPKNADAMEARAALRLGMRDADP